MADTAMSGAGTAGGDDPLQRAIWRLRSRGCWTDAAALLTPHAHHAGAAVQRTALLVERCLFTGQGWPEAEDALRVAEAVARDDDERGAAACERGQLAYAATVLGVRDRADEARSALGRAAALLSPGSRTRPLLDFRRGLVAEHLADAPQSAARRTGGPTRGRWPTGTPCCCPSRGATWPRWRCGTGRWRRPGRASRSRCASGRTWGS
ncbi:conserved hypothetical protein [Streptomyces sp. Mg1]|nr:conserved hypothetical protein [Streptomyces sp. Mg1]